jgi:alkanesulfonate monooxygenase SsuD/methylene tetrahydromethanopterin reductase-like flavin-dependent oxidoreductase (luciferase family)
MRFSVWPLNHHPIGDIVEVCAHAERTGWDGVWMADHLMPSNPPLDSGVTECWTAMTAIAALVPRVRVGSLVLGNTFRHPAVLAKMAATLAALAPGRLVLGIGAGWQVNEHTAYGIDLPSPRQRLDRLDEACTILRNLLDTGVASSPANGHYALTEAHLAPRPAVRVPLLVGVKGDKALRLAARHADEWNLWASPEMLAERTAVLLRHCDAEGRDPSTISRSAQAIVALPDPSPPPAERWARSGMPMLAGSIAEMQDRLGAYAAADLDELIVPDFALGTGSARLDALDRFLAEVAAPFRSAGE